MAVMALYEAFTSIGITQSPYYADSFLMQIRTSDGLWYRWEVTFGYGGLEKRNNNNNNNNDNKAHGPILHARSVRTPKPSDPY